MTYLTENAMELMEQFFELKLLQSKNTLHKFKKYLKIIPQTNVEFGSDSDEDNEGV